MNRDITKQKQWQKIIKKHLREKRASEISLETWNGDIYPFSTRGLIWIIPPEGNVFINFEKHTKNKNNGNSRWGQNCNSTQFKKTMKIVSCHSIRRIFVSDESLDKDKCTYHDGYKQPSQNQWRHPTMDNERATQPMSFLFTNML